MTSLPAYHAYLKELPYSIRAELFLGILKHKYGSKFDLNDYLGLGLIDNLPPEDPNALSGEEFIETATKDAIDSLEQREEPREQFLDFIEQLLISASHRAKPSWEDTIKTMKEKSQTASPLLEFMNAMADKVKEREFAHDILGNEGAVRQELIRRFPDAHVERILGDLKEVFPSVSQNVLFDEPKQSQDPKQDLQ